MGRQEATELSPFCHAKAWKRLRLLSEEPIALSSPGNFGLRLKCTFCVQTAVSSAPGGHLPPGKGYFASLNLSLLFCKVGP
jgi:hypothetical protein